MIPPAPREGRSASLLLCLLVAGGLGFAAGFIGPIILVPDANQGPLVGIFISGPAGFVLGLLLYIVFRVLHISPARQWQTLWISSLALATVTLFMILPSPKSHGYIQEVRIDSCKRPIDQADEAIEEWKKNVAANSASARPDWQEDSRQMLQEDAGVILAVTIIREKKILETQKPWNKGQVVAQAWKPVKMQKSYYALYGGGDCANYPTGARSVLFNDLFFYGYPEGLGWPPRKAANFLDLQTLESVPDKYREFARD